MIEKITTIWVAKQDIHIALAIITDFMVNPPLPGTQAKPIPFLNNGFEVVDDRGGSEHFWLRVEDWSVAQARRVFKDTVRFHIEGLDK